jgi:AcrR family transcriptional regulator
MTSPLRPQRASADPGSESRSYHHGDLKRALIESAKDILRNEGQEALTLRAVARAAGVSPTAPYRHFADRRSLVAAVAEEGFHEMGLAMRHAMAVEGGRKGFKQIGLAYVRFAHEHSAEYRVMFGAELAQRDDLPGLLQQSRSVIEFVAHGIAELQKAGVVGPGEPRTLAVTVWAVLHGLVMLSLDGQTAASGLSVDELVEEATRMIMFGMAPR